MTKYQVFEAYVDGRRYSDKFHDDGQDYSAAWLWELRKVAGEPDEGTFASWAEEEA